ncbi:MAG: hypothetical protein NTZ98_23255 [Acidobacteria bacterium]|nr:hypothetical protein [Acidobacteriota bacterium]
MACHLRERPHSIDFDATVGDKVTLIAEDHIGNVMIAKAKYGDTDLVPDGTAVSRLDFTVAAGSVVMVLIFVFSAQEAGEGALREDCGGGSTQLLRDVSGDEPKVSFRINGKAAA